MLLLNPSLSFYWIKLSVSKSTLAVASSRTKIFVSLIIALAKHINYFYPTEKRLLLSETCVSNLSFILSIWSNKLTSFKTLITSESSFSLKGSIFSLIVPYKRKGY